ncbi:RNA polymerase sigma factor [Flagellimonas sp.]|uniref:RNA polymerase sigma factor n=1 Tax=Flagellimonas sp. TaxID=2058762 RepID=UPI003BAECA57
MEVAFEKEFVLIQHLKKGNEKAYAYMVDRYSHKLCAYASSLTNDPVVAQDIVQQVFIKVWERKNRLNANFSFSNFLHKSVYNEFIDQYRKRQAVTLLEKKYIDALGHIVEQDQSLLEKQIALVRREIQNLPPKCKQVFLLSKQEGLTNLEIAEYLSVSTKAVEGHITKAFSILRKKMKGKMEGVFFVLFPFLKQGFR